MQKVITIGDLHRDIPQSPFFRPSIPMQGLTSPEPLSNVLLFSALAIAAGYLVTKYAPHLVKGIL